MHPAAQRYLNLDFDDQKKAQIFLCKRALEIWERLVPENLSYQESVAGSTQIFDAKLPQIALDAVESGLDSQNLDARYREPLAALEDEDIEFSKNAEFAYYSIRNLYTAHILHKPVDPWLVVNQALSAIGPEDAIVALEEAVRCVS